MCVTSAIHDHMGIYIRSCINQMCGQENLLALLYVHILLKFLLLVAFSNLEPV